MDWKLNPEIQSPTVSSVFESEISFTLAVFIICREFSISNVIARGRERKVEMMRDGCMQTFVQRNSNRGITPLLPRSKRPVVSLSISVLSVPSEA